MEVVESLLLTYADLILSSFKLNRNTTSVVGSERGSPGNEYQGLAGAEST